MNFLMLFKDKWQRYFNSLSYLNWITRETIDKGKGPWAGRVHRASPLWLSCTFISPFNEPICCQRIFSDSFSVLVYICTSLGQKAKIFVTQLFESLSLTGTSCGHIYRHYHVVQCLGFTMVPRKVRVHLGFWSKIKKKNCTPIPPKNHLN